MRKWISLNNPFFGLTFIITIFLILFYFGVSNNINWLTASVPSFFGGVATILVGSYAFILYKRQKDDIKKDTANIILLEILSAEKVLKAVQDSLEKELPELPNDAISMPTESWSKNKYLFVSDFSDNQWEAIGDFYKACSLFDEAVRTNASYFQKHEEQTRINIQKKAGDFVEGNINRIKGARTDIQRNELKRKLSSDILDWSNLYIEVATPYYPKKPVNDAKLNLEKMKLNISLSSAIEKLKELAKTS